jgi:hypothetical protein
MNSQFQTFDFKSRIFQTHNRVCVALYRVRHGLYAVGNFDFPANSEKGSTLWKEINQSVIAAEDFGAAFPIECQNHGVQQMVSTAEEFRRLSPEGGCQQICDTRKKAHQKTFLFNTY